jgi:hypothetical protein
VAHEGVRVALNRTSARTALEAAERRAALRLAHHPVESLLLVVFLCLGW